MLEAGVVFALCALVGWGFGDYFIQKTTRLLGVHQTLFLICAAGAIVLLPFVRDEIRTAGIAEYQAILWISVVIGAYAAVIFQALKRGKLSVVESVVAFELPLTVSLGVFVGGETLSAYQVMLFFCIFFGILFAAASHLDHLKYHRHIFEKGVMWALGAAFFSALNNYVIGAYAQTMSPLFIIWASHALIALVLLGAIIARGEWRGMVRVVRKHPLPVVAQGVFDNGAWLSYAVATTSMPISLTVMISESYIALAAVLGFVLGKERLNVHQIVGAVIAFISVMLLIRTLV